MVAVKLSDQRASGPGRSDRRCTISAVKDEALGTNGTAAYIQVQNSTAYLIPLHSTPCTRITHH